MTKYKLNNDNTSTTGSQITLTSYMVGESIETDEENTPKYATEQKKGISTILDLPQEKYTRQKINASSFNVKPTLKEWLKDRARRGCTRKLIYKRVPILTWLPKYNVSSAISDFVAGLTVGLTVIPQGIAYSNVAGLPPQIGLYSSFMACFVYTIFGSCKEAPIGPTAIAGLLTRENNHGFGVNGAVLLCFLSGCVEFLMGLLQLDLLTGFLIDFISGPVSIGFTSAAAIIIATTQVKDVLGLNYPGGKFLQVWEQIFEHITETRLWDSILGLSCMAVLIILR
ncbi:Sulfate tra GLY domain containing protein, partial [Asbolus verrucosus]